MFGLDQNECIIAWDVLLVIDRQAKNKMVQNWLVCDLHWEIRVMYECIVAI